MSMSRPKSLGLFDPMPVIHVTFDDGTPQGATGQVGGSRDIHLVQPRYFRRVFSPYMATPKNSGLASGRTGDLRGVHR